MMTKSLSCLLCDKDYPKYYQVAIRNTETNEPVYIKMSEKQKNNYLELLKKIQEFSKEEIQKAEIILKPEGYEIRWKE